MGQETGTLGKLGLFFRLLQSWAGNRLSRLNNQFSPAMGWRTTWCSHKPFFFLRSVSFRVISSRQAWAGETLLLQTAGNTSEIGLVFLMYNTYCLTLYLLRNYCPSWAFFVGWGFYFLLSSCRSNRLSAGMGWRADYHYSYIRTETYRRPVGMMCLTSDLLWFLILQLTIFCGARVWPWWGLPQSVAVGVICPHLNFPELICNSDL